MVSPQLSFKHLNLSYNMKSPVQNNKFTILKKVIGENFWHATSWRLGKSKKMMKHVGDNFKDVQHYMKGKVLTNCRMSFRIICEMVGEIKWNFKDKYRRKGGEEALKCDDCLSDQIQTQSHCLTCPHWEDIRKDLVLDKLEGMVTFFQRMLKERLNEKTGS